MRFLSRPPSSKTTTRTGVGRRPRLGLRLPAVVPLSATARGCSNSASTTVGSANHPCCYTYLANTLLRAARPNSASTFPAISMISTSSPLTLLIQRFRHAAWSGHGAAAQGASSSATKATMWCSVDSCRRTATAPSEPGAAGVPWGSALGRRAPGSACGFGGRVRSRGKRAGKKK